MKLEWEKISSGKGKKGGNCKKGRRKREKDGRIKREVRNMKVWKCNE